MRRRRFTKHKKNGKYVLDTWTQNKCVICGRFLAKKQLKYCSICSVRIDKEKNRLSQIEWIKKHPNYHKEHLKAYRHRKGISINYRGII